MFKLGEERKQKSDVSRGKEQDYYGGSLNRI